MDTLSEARPCRELADTDQILFICLKIDLGAIFRYVGEYSSWHCYELHSYQQFIFGFNYFSEIR